MLKTNSGINQDMPMVFGCNQQATHRQNACVAFV